jgi:cell wall-associated NlpC family hydrolase
LAAYNAGEGAVLQSGGMPDLVPDHFSQTQPYVRNILGMEPAFRAPGGSGEFVPDRTGSVGDQVLRAGRQWLGTPYVFGGGGPQGPTGGGFDMPGLTSAAVSAATGGSVSLPRTAEEQWGAGTEVPLGQARPGDLVFGGFGVSGPSAVGIYSGNGTMIVAQSGGKVVSVPVTADMRARRVE